MDPIQSTLHTERLLRNRPTESIRSRAQQDRLPELTQDEETMIHREFDPERSSVRYDRRGEASQAASERGRRVDWRI